MSDIKKLKSLLEGSRVLNISETIEPEARCRFEVESPSKERISFILYATELGNWIGGLEREDKYDDLGEMFESIYNHQYGCNKTIQYINRFALVGSFRCDCGKSFLINEKNVKTKYIDILKNSEKMYKLAELLSGGEWFPNPEGYFGEL